MEGLYTAEAVVVTLRGHVHVEEGLTRLIRAGLKRGQLLEPGKMSFKGKLDLAAAAGLIDEDSVAWYTAFNRMRNRVAHHNPEVTRGDVLNLYAVVNPYQKRTCDILLLGADQDALLMLRVQIAVMAAEMEARLQSLEA